MGYIDFIINFTTLSVIFTCLFYVINAFICEKVGLKRHKMIYTSYIKKENFTFEHCNIFVYSDFI